MATGFPTFKLYESDGTTLVYEFEFVTFIDDNKDPARFIEHQALRGQGSIISAGSNSPWDLSMDFILVGTGITASDRYESVTAKIDTIKSSIVKFTKYILKVQKTSGGSTQDYKVMRLDPFNFETASTNRKRINVQKVESVFRVDTWA